MIISKVTMNSRPRKTSTIIISHFVELSLVNYKVGLSSERSPVRVSNAVEGRVERLARKVLDEDKVRTKYLFSHDVCPLCGLSVFD